jgi:hypothetical protein
MRKALIWCALVASGCLAQSPYLSKAISEEKSTDFNVRFHAMVMLAREDSPQARRELVNLLKSENQVADEAVRTAGGTDAVYGENYAEYYAQLQDIVMKLAEDPAYSEGLDALVMAGPEPDTKEAKWLALHGSTITPSIVKQISLLS